MQKQLRVYRTFLLGLCIGLAYAIIISDKAASLPIPPWLNIFEQRILVLTMSGILGGIIYTIMVDGNVELPRFTDQHGNRFEAGLLGDMLLGIAGAFILEFLTSPLGVSEEIKVQLQAETSYIAIAAKGIIGGYGSKSLMDIALNRALKQVREREKQREHLEQANEELASDVDALETERQELLEGQALIQQLNHYIDRGLPGADVDHLVTSIRHAAPEIQEQVFQITKHLRQTTSRTEEFRASTHRTIPIFIALVDSQPQQAGYHAQLAFAYKDSESPLTRSILESALHHLNEAIALRPPQDRAHTWKYELNRAIVRIEQETMERRAGVQLGAVDPDYREQIVEDLLTVADIQGLPRVMEQASQYQLPNPPIINWIQLHHDWLRRHDEAGPIVAELMLLLQPDSTRPNLEQPEAEPSVDPPLSEVPESYFPESEVPESYRPEPDIPAAGPTEPGERGIEERDRPPNTYPPEPTEHTQDSSFLEDTQAQTPPSHNGREGSSPTPGVISLPEDDEDTAHYLDILKEAAREGSAPTTEPSDESDKPRFPIVLESQNDQDSPPFEASAAEPERDRWSAALDRARPIGAVGTASRAALTVTGMVASYQLARQDQDRVTALLDRFRWAGAKYGLPPALLAAIASRESRCGADLTSETNGDTPYFGIMQLDQQNVTPMGQCGTMVDSACQHHIDEAADLLAVALQQMSQQYPDWADEYVLQGAIAAYNVGVEHVQMATTAEIDRGTTGQDYSSDVMARAQFFAETFPELATVPVDMLLPGLSSPERDAIEV